MTGIYQVLTTSYWGNPIDFKLWGAGGGSGNKQCGSSSNNGGAGGFVSGTLLGYTSGTLNIYVGAGGSLGVVSNYGGGGPGGDGDSGSGGGATYIYLGSTLLMVAGAGAGQGAPGGYPNGIDSCAGSGGTQTAGGIGCPGGYGGGGGGYTSGSFLQGGQGAGCNGGGGGSGYYGGGGGSGDCGSCPGATGGGGSGYYHPTLISNFAYSNGSGTTPGGNTDADWANSAGTGGAWRAGSGYPGRVVITIKGTKYTFGYTGSLQTLAIT